MRVNWFQYLLARSKVGSDSVYIKCEDCDLMTRKTWKYHICVVIEGGKRISMKKVWNPTLQCWVMAPSGEEDVRLLNRYWDAKRGLWVDNKTPDAQPVLESCGIRVPKFKELLTQKVLGPGDFRENKHNITCYCDVCREENNLLQKHHSTCVCMACRPQHIKDHGLNCVCNECWKWKVNKNISSTSYGYQGYKWKPAVPWEGLGPKDENGVRKMDLARWPNTFKYLLKFHFHKEEDQGKYIDSEEYRDRVVKGIYKSEPQSSHDYDVSYGEC